MLHAAEKKSFPDDEVSDCLRDCKPVCLKTGQDCQISCQDDSVIQKKGKQCRYQPLKAV